MGGASAKVESPDYGAGGQAGGSAEASFALWHDLLGAGNNTGDAGMLGGRMDNSAPHGVFCNPI